MLGLIEIRNYRIYKVCEDAASGEITRKDITPKGRYKYVDKLNGFTITANGIDTAKRYFERVYRHYGLMYVEKYITRLVKNGAEYGA